MIDPAPCSLHGAAERLRGLGVDRIETFAWRDLGDNEAGGSERHADEILSRWASVGFDIEHRTSAHRGRPARTFERNGYRVVQRGGRSGVFARVIARQLGTRLSGRSASNTATVEIWNGVPWFGPLWASRRHVVWLHHVHRNMWADVLPRPLDAAGRFLETRIAPRCYRRSAFATLSESSADEIAEIGIHRDRLTVIPPGVHERFTPDESQRSDTPEVVVVGRLTPVKRQRLALDALARARDLVPDLRVRLVGDGPDRGSLESWVAAHDATEWVRFDGWVSDDALVHSYRSAWLILSTSHAEGWGMSLTEGGACGTPCVATDVAGHRDAVLDGATGLLVSRCAEPTDIGTAVATLLHDRASREAMGRAATARASTLSWDDAAARHLGLLCDTVAGRRAQSVR